MFKGYSIDQLSAAFDRICDPVDWRNEITATMPGESVMLAVAAIEFYTATMPKVELDVATMRYLVTSEGYRMGPAGS